MIMKKTAGASLGKTSAISSSPDEMNWKAKSDLQNMMDHHEAMSDPVRVKNMKKLVGRHNKAISSLAELKDVANNYSKTKGMSGDDEAEEKIS
jgi:hypothetical protein